MKFLGALLVVVLTGLWQLSLAQRSGDVTDCTEISTDLETEPIDPVASENQTHHRMYTVA